MNLTAEQLCEVMLALQHGMSAAAWEGRTDRPWWELSEEEKSFVLNSMRSVHEEVIGQSNPDPAATKFNQMFLDRMHLASVQNEERQEQAIRAKLLQAVASRRTVVPGILPQINSLLAPSDFFDRFQRRAIERRLAAKKLPTLAMLQAMLRKKHEKILKRGAIRTEEEYDLVMEILNFVDFPIEEESRHRLSAIVGDFEAGKKPQ